MGRGAKNCSTTIMNRKKIGEAPQFVKKSSPKMAIFQLENLKKIMEAPQFVKNYTQKCLFFAK